MIRVLMADGQHLVRGTLKALLETELDSDIVTGATDGIETTQRITEQDVDAALIDIEMPRLNGINTTTKISDHCRCLIVATFARPGYLKRAFQVGTSGFLARDTPLEQLAEAIRRIHSDLRVIDPALAEASLSTADSPLTDREVEIARLIPQGVDTGTIAGQLFIAKGTMRNQVSLIITKTSTSDRVEATKTAHDNGWLQKIGRNTALIFIESLLLSQCEGSLLPTA